MKFMRTRSSNLTILFAILGGAAAGATLALIFSPDKGENIRHRIAGELNRLKESVTEKVTALATAADDLSASVKSTLRN
jgi:gas vesicle protein